MSLSDVPYDRVRLMLVLDNHRPTVGGGCDCGWKPYTIGTRFSLHITQTYEFAMSERALFDPEP